MLGGPATRLAAALCVAALAMPAACKRQGAAAATGTAGRGGAAGSSAAGQGGAAGGSLAGVGGTSVTAGSGGATGGPWTSVPGVAPCALEVADPPQIDIVPFVWTDCGPGCTTTAAKVLATDEYVFNRLASARNYPDGVHVRLATMRGSSTT